MKIKFTHIALIISILFNLLGLGLGFAYLDYADLSVPYALSRVPYVVDSMLGANRLENESFRLFIIQECPELGMPSITDYEKVQILRHWVATVIDYSTSSLLLSRRLSGFSSLAAHDIYKLFVNNEGGVWCFSSAVFLGKIYKLFGFETYLLSYGTEDAITHALNLVRVRHNGQDILTIQDAYFDMTYELSDNEPIDYFNMLTFLKQGQADLIFVIEPNPPLMREFHKEALADKSQTKSIITTRVLFTTDFILAEYSDDIDTFLTARGLPPTLIYLHLFPFWIGGDSQGELLDKARQITGWSLPLRVEVE